MAASASAVSDANPPAIGPSQVSASSAANALLETLTAQHNPGAIDSAGPTTASSTTAGSSSVGKPFAAVSLSRPTGGPTTAATGTRGTSTSQGEPHGRHDIHDQDPGAVAGADPSAAADPVAPASDAATTAVGDQGSTADMTQSTVVTSSPVFQTSASIAAETAYAATAPAQVSAALVTMTPQADGSSRLAVSLQPKDLGAVHIQVERSADGAVRVVVAADEPATLRSLMTSQADLHAALDAASVPATNRHLSFELSNTSSPAATISHTNMQSSAEHQQDTSLPQGSEGQQASDMSGSGSSDHSDWNNAQEDRRQKLDQIRSAVGTAEPLADLPQVIGAAGRMRRFGNINITA